MKKISQRQEVFEKNCGDDGNFITLLEITISYMIVTLFNAVYIEATGMVIKLMFLVISWLLIAASISTFYYTFKNKDIEG